MAHSSVRIDSEVAEAALQNWQAAVEALRRTVAERGRAIGAAESVGPWGGDAYGRQFGGVYAEGAAPSRTATESVTARLEALGASVRTAVRASLDSDEVQAAALAPAQATLDRR